MTVKYTKATIVLAAVIATLVNYNVYLQSKVSRLEHMVQMSDARSGINQEWADEVTHIMLNKLSSENEEGMRNQGSMEGIVEYLTNPKEYHSVWHEGYQHGLNQSEEMAKMEKGELFPTDKPMPVKPDVIKKPDFDKKIEKAQDTGGE